MTKPDRIRMTHLQFGTLCLWTEKQSDNLWDSNYSERALMASMELGFPVTADKAKEASILTNCDYKGAQIALVHYALVALAASGGTTVQNLARKGRELEREKLKAKAGDGTLELFQEVPADTVTGPDVSSEDEMPDMG